MEDGPSVNLLYLGIKGRVIGIDAASGEIRWQTRLKGGGFVNLTKEGKRIDAATRGELWALDSESGKILWQQGLAGMGHGYIAFAAREDNLAALVRQISDDGNAAAASGSAGAV